jgi:hypothetical protein
MHTRFASQDQIKPPAQLHRRELEEFYNIRPSDNHVDNLFVDYSAIYPQWIELR